MPSLQLRVSSTIQAGFFSAFYKWGFLVGRKPKTVVISSVIITILLSLRLILAVRNPLPSETRQEKLFAPQESVGVKDYERFKDLWGLSNRRSVVYFTSKPKGANVLTSSVLQEVQRFDSMVNTQLYASDYKTGRAWSGFDANYSHSDLCVRSRPSGSSTVPACSRRSDPLEFFELETGNYNFDHSDEEMLNIINSGKGIDPVLFPAGSSRRLNVEGMFGGITRDESGAITKVESIAVTFLLENGQRDSDKVERAKAFEEELNYMVGMEWTLDPPVSEGSATKGLTEFESDDVDMYPYTSGAISREFGASISGDVIALNIGLMCIAAYCLFILTRCRTPKKSRSMLACAGLVACGFAIAISYSVGSLFLDLNTVVSVLPFILIGIGVDDAFVLINALDATSVDMPVPERIATAMANAGVSITITSVTDFFAFALGATSSLPGLATFCGFAAIGIFADFAMQITFFAGWMALDAHREKRDRNDCCCLVACCPKGTSQSPIFNFYPQLQTLNKKYYVPLLRNKVVKGVVLIFFLVFTCINAWQASLLKQDFKRTWFINDDVKLQEAVAIEEEYYGESGLSVSITTPHSSEFDYGLASSQRSLLTLVTEVNGNKWVEDGSVAAWYPFFIEWLHVCDTTQQISGSSCVGRDCRDSSGSLAFAYCTNGKYQRDVDAYLVKDSAGNNIVTGASEKYTVLEDGTRAPDNTTLAEVFVPKSEFFFFLDQYLADDPVGVSFSGSFMWVAGAAQNLTRMQAEEGIAGAKYRANHIKLKTADDQIAAMRELRDSVAAANVGDDAYPFAFVYIFYEQFAIIRREAFVNLGLALAAVFIITLLFLGTLHGSLMVVICVIMVDVDILGLMQLWGLTIDSVSIINLVLAVGLSVDYSCHVVHAFITAKGTKQERADIAIGEMGTAVLHGALSTFSAVVILSTSQSYVFRIFFKQFFGICIFGAAHGLLFLPVLLSLVGPEPLEDNMNASPKEGGKIVEAGEVTTSTATNEKQTDGVAPAQVM